jgi:nitrate/nitrite transporter NarK
LSGGLLHSLPDQSSRDLHAIVRGCIECNCQLVTRDCEATLDIFSDVAREKSGFKMVSNGSIMFIDSIGPEVCVVLGSTAIYTYTPELHPTEIRATAMGIASAWGRVGAVTMLLVFGYFFAILGKSLLFLMIDPVLIVAAIVVLCFGPSTRGKPLQETQLGVPREPLSG